MASLVEDAPIPLAQLRLLKLRTKGRPQVDIAPQADEVYNDIVGRGGSGKTTTLQKRGPAAGIGEAAAPKAQARAGPMIRFDAMLQYSAEESVQMAETVVQFVDSLQFISSSSDGRREDDQGDATAADCTAQLDGGRSPVTPVNACNYNLDLEVDQTAQLDDLAHWRRSLLSAVRQTTSN